MIDNSIFNLEKNENQWIKESLVKDPTIAINYDEFKKIIKQKEPRFLFIDLNDLMIFWNLLLIMNIRKNIDFLLILIKYVRKNIILYILIKT